MKKNQRLKIIAAIIILLIFIVDFFIPPGTALPILYIIPLTISYKLSTRAIFSFAVILSILSCLDLVMFFNSERMNHSIIADRVLSIVAIWASSFVILKYKRAIKKRDKNKEDYIDSIEKMAFQVSHEVRRPICHIQGISNILDSEDFSKEDLEKVCDGIKDSVKELDIFTKTLTDFLENVHKRIK